MRRVIFILLIFVCVVTFAQAQEETEESKPFNLDAGAGLSIGFFDADEGDLSDFVGFWQTLLSMRGGIFADFRFCFSKIMSIGVEAGLYGMSVESNGETSFFLDIPIRAIVRFGADKSFVQALAGYYIPVMSFEDGTSLGGWEIGAKASLIGIYVAGSYIIGDLNYFRLELGWAWNNIL